MDFKDKLSALPKKWQEQLIEVMCTLQNDTSNVKCEETTTSLSDFYFQENKICIDYTDEKSVTYSRCFDLDNFLSQQLNDIDVSCMLSQTTWDALSFNQKINYLITRFCNEAA